MTDGPNRSMRLWAVVVVALLLLIGSGVWWTSFRTYRFAVVEEGKLYRDGVRSRRELETAYRKAQFRTVVNLVSQEEAARPEFQDEAAMCREKGIELVRIAVKEGAQPTDEDVEKFLSVAKDASRWPLLVHCAQGIQRTGMMVAAYQQRVLGYDKQRTLDAVLGFGKGVERTDAVKAFIERRYAAAAASPTTMQAAWRE